MEIKKCKLCGGNYKSIEMHLTTCLRKYNKTREQYSELPEYSTEEKTAVKEEKIAGDTMEELKEGIGPEDMTKIPETDSGISQKDIIRNVFKGAAREIDDSTPLGEVLSMIEITKEDFLSLVKYYKGEGGLPARAVAHRTGILGSKEAESLKDKSDVKVTNLAAAEALVKEHGFKVVDVRSPQGNTPKTWVLTKKA